MAKQVGQFKIEGGTLYGPSRYMAEQGSAKLDAILDGEDVVFNVGCTIAPDIETAILVAMQTDYAGWIGKRQFLASFGGDQIDAQETRNVQQTEPAQSAGKPSRNGAGPTPAD
ncbi:MAG: hypothetical protein ACREDR_00145 [Blastocatellia bacterium]